ncbi:MAG TPA: enoyl-CoA hydratase/isomerase family protein [Acidimicrobiales bacterium]|jgi:enoyl-CoA hydratase/carnithine racemase
MGLDVERDGDVVVAVWRDGENRINLDTIGALDDLLDSIEHTEGPVALVLSGDGKFFSNGLDLERFGADPGEFGRTATSFHRLLGRLYVLPAYTVAAVNGHAFAGGAMLSCAFDHRIMRQDRGYWCLNEAELGLPLTPQMAAAVLGRLPRSAALEAMLTARRYTADDARAAGIVEEVAPLDELLEVGVAHAAVVAKKDRGVVAAHKRIAHEAVARACGWEPESLR